MLLAQLSIQKSVAQVAMACGFFHLGRFAAQQAQTFEETPVETTRLATTGKRRWTQSPMLSG
jgi:transcriptional regulator GlxA family with amidase domain